jgi:hypothetical protein
MKYSKSDYVLVVENLAPSTRSGDIRYEMEYWGNVRRCERDRAMRVALVEFDRCEALPGIRFFCLPVLLLGHWVPTSGGRCGLCRLILSSMMSIVVESDKRQVQKLFETVDHNASRSNGIFISCFTCLPNVVSALRREWPFCCYNASCSRWRRSSLASPRHLASSGFTEAAAFKDTVCSSVEGSNIFCEMPSCTCELFDVSCF